MKLAMRPRNRPMGVTAEQMSATVRAGICVRCAKYQTPSAAPASPPWKDMPPCQTAMMSWGLAR